VRERGLVGEPGYPHAVPTVEGSHPPGPLGVHRLIGVTVVTRVETTAAAHRACRFAT